MEVRFGVPVDCSDASCGTLTRVVVDRHRLTHLLLREGHLLRKKEVPIPASLEAVADALRPR